MVKAKVREIIARALGKLGFEEIDFQLEPPKQAAHGDFAANAALVLQKIAKSNPRKLAQEIIEKIEDPHRIIESIEIAGPGFLNITLTKSVWQRELEVVWLEKATFGRSNAGGGLKTMVEFVSANPTGPMHVGHGRGAVLGDVIANLLEWAGYSVYREFYINDAGGQVWRLAHAVWARARNEPLAPDDYQGEYVIEVARAWVEQGGDASRPFEEIRESLRSFSTTWILESLIKKDLELFGIRFDNFFSEKKLHDADELSAAVKMLEEKGMTAIEVLPPPKGQEDEEYVEKPLLVVKTTRFGDDRDRPLFKTSGEPTYFAADVAYHFDKLSRGHRRLIDVWGADHAGYVQRMKAAVKAMGGELEVIIFQLVNLLKDGQPFRMSKRAANFVTLRELLEAAGSDATRVFFLLRRGDMALDFDIGLAQRRDNDNPVFYVQYGHARCAAILRKAREDQGAEPRWDAEAMSALQLPEEIDLIKRVLQFPELVAHAAQALEPHKVVFYLQETIAAFHGYYTRYKKTERVISDDPRKTAARLYLVWALKQTLANALSILGVSAPERMDAAEEVA